VRQLLGWCGRVSCDRGHGHNHDHDHGEADLLLLASGADFLPDVLFLDALVWRLLALLSVEHEVLVGVEAVAD
jgi:hypothetical protein